MVDVNSGEKYWNIKVENTMNGDIVIGVNGLPQTSKGDKYNHGIGLLNIKNTVEKYSGRYEIKTQKGRFITQIYLKK